MGSRSSAGRKSCISASAPESGRRQSQLLSRDGIATHSRPRAKTKSPGAKDVLTPELPTERQALGEAQRLGVRERYPSQRFVI